MAGERFFDYGRTFVQPIPMRPQETALLIIDMQYHDASPDHGFNLALDKLDPGCMDYFNKRNEEVVIPTIRRLLGFFRSRGLRVVYLTLGSKYRDLRDVPDRLRRWIRQLEHESGVLDIFWAGNPAFAIRKEIEPLPDETVIAKTTFGAFNSSPIEQVLRELGVRTLIITGISTNCCVETTARDAADRGFACVIVDEGTADYDEDAHDAALRAFHFNFGRVVRTAQDVSAALGAEAAI
ncbi:MAG TPA: cysteine hydrolase [Candidatus Eisenbacteria bacterium]|jgi:nicotinamidase-related amidase